MSIHFINKILSIIRKEKTPLLSIFSFYTDMHNARSQARTGIVHLCIFRNINPANREPTRRGQQHPHREEKTSAP